MADVYVCEFDTDPQGWVAEVVAVGIDDGGESAVAFDGIINHFEGGPINAGIVEDTSAKLVTAWSYKVKSGTNQQARMRYRLAIFKERSQGVMRVRAAGFGNIIEERGRCQRSNLSMDQIRRGGS